MINQNQIENIQAISSSLIDNPADVEIAAFLLQNGFSIRDFFLYLEISELIRLNWENVDGVEKN